MLNPLVVIKSINKVLETFYIIGEGGQLLLERHKIHNTFRLRASGYSSEAYDDYGNCGENVKVIKWFSDYWLFIEIKFYQNSGVIISLSVFQGEECEFKNQLFRAEWDDYGSGTMNHAQPHWHFVSDKSVERVVSSFASLIPEVQGTFAEVLDQERGKFVDLSKFHFAMNGDWSNSSSHVHSIIDEKSLSKWFGGLLAYLKNELKYIDEKRGK